MCRQGEYVILIVHQVAAGGNEVNETESVPRGGRRPYLAGFCPVVGNNIVRGTKFVRNLRKSC